MISLFQIPAEIEAIDRRLATRGEMRTLSQSVVSSRRLNRFGTPAGAVEEPA